MAENQKPESACRNSRTRWDVLMNRKFIVAILLVVAVPVCAQAQNPEVSTGDAQKVVTIISGDKAKTQAYCDIRKLSEQIGQAYEKNDNKMVEELSLKIETLEKALGPEYVALVDGLPDILGNDLLGAEFIAAIASLDSLCTKVSIENSEDRWRPCRVRIAEPTTFSIRYETTCSGSAYQSHGAPFSGLLGRCRHA
jgi:hypothetical protein